MTPICVRFEPTRVAPTRAVALLPLLFAACGGDDGEVMMPPPPPPLTTISYQVEDPCGDLTPRPTDLFRDAAGRPELDTCPLPMDPLDAAVEQVLRDQRAGFSPEIVLPVDGALDLGTLSSTVTISFSGGGDAEGLPAVALIELTGTATDTTAWRQVEVSTDLGAENTIVLRPTRPLLPDRLHVVVATRALRDTESPARSLGPSRAVEALVDDAAISAGAFDGLGDEGAARLERMRTTLAPALDALADARPSVRPDDIVSIHAFTTRPGDDLVEQVVEKYEAAVRAGVYPYAIEIEARDIPPSQVYGANVPASVYPNVGTFVRGVVKAPRMLDDELRLRAGWETETETVDVPFLMSIPRAGTSYPVAVQVAGYGRSRLDARALANAMGGGPRGSALAIELRCHGRRSPGLDGRCEENRTEAEASILIDEVSNNGNPELSGSDGIPDSSGNGYFPGDPRQLRDTQIASVIEIAHVVASLRQGTAWTDENIPINRNSVHLVAQGYTALPAAAAAGLAQNALRPVTVQFPAGGADLSELILEGATAQREAFEATLVGTIGIGQAETLLIRLADYLAPVEIGAFGSAVADRFTVRGQIRGVLLPHPSPGDQGTTQYVSAEARDALIDGIGLRSGLVSRHTPRCDNYFVFTCRLGNPPNLLEDARAQISGFIDSNGSTIPDPG